MVAIWLAAGVLDGGSLPPAQSESVFPIIYRRRRRKR